MTQFSIRLYSPTSTSKQIAVSINFADQNGMIITLNNDSIEGKYLPFFDCSWISRYPDEDERVFVNGFFPITVKAIRIMQSSRNYTELFASLFLFECLLSGSFTNGMSVYDSLVKRKRMRVIEELLVNEELLDASEMKAWTQQELSTMNQLLAGGYTNEEAANAILFSSKQSVSSEPFVSSMFSTYIKQKKHITILMVIIDAVHQTAKAISILSSMIVENSRMQSKFVNSTGALESLRLNLLSSKVFKLTPNVKTLTIDTSDYLNHSDQCKCYSFNLLYFLDAISSSHRWKQIRIQYEDRKKRKSWIFYVWKTSGSILKQAYQEKKLEIEFGEIQQIIGNTPSYREYLLIKRAVE